MPESSHRGIDGLLTTHHLRKASGSVKGRHHQEHMVVHVPASRSKLAYLRRRRPLRQMVPMMITMKPGLRASPTRASTRAIIIEAPTSFPALTRIIETTLHDDERPDKRSDGTMTPPTLHHVSASGIS